MAPVRPVLAGALLAAGLSGGLSVGLAPAAYAEDVETDCTGLVNIPADPEITYVTDEVSQPLVAMGVPAAQERLVAGGESPGAGVTVAVIDSGVFDVPGMTVIHDPVEGIKKPVGYYHGTAVAGLIAGPARPEEAGGPIGIAPGAQILDVQVYDDPQAEDDSPDAANISVERVLLGLDKVIARTAELNIKVAVIALALPFDDRAMRQRIARLWKQGVIVVAATGNRPSSDDGSYLASTFAEHQSGEDARDAVHPADFKNVVGANSSMTGLPDGVDPYGFVLENSATDVAAPTASGVSYSPIGGTCVLGDPATSWAAAETAGALALLQAHYQETPAQAVARLRETANGRPDVPNTLVGAGEIQLVEALTRPLQIDERGNVIGQGEVTDQPQQVSAPEEPPDLLAATRANAVWWGLLGGGTLLLALVLRPVLARRRRTVTGL